MKIFNKFILLIVFVLLLSIFMSGCSDSIDINKRIIATTVVLDKKDGEVWFYLEYANTETSDDKANGGGSSGNKFSFIKAHGKNIIEARENLNRQLQKPLYLSAVRVLVLTENFAKDNILEYLYRLRQDETYRKKILTVITRDDPEEMLKSNNEKNHSLGYSIESLLVTLKDSGKSYSRVTESILENLSNKEDGMLLTCIGLQNKQDILKGYSVLNGTTIDGFIPAENSNGVVILKAEKPEINYVIPYKDTNFTITVNLNKRTVKPSYSDWKISYEINFTFDAYLLYGDTKIPYNFEEEATAEVTKSLTETLKSEILSAVEQSQKEFHCDYFQFDDEFRVKYPDEFAKMDWETEYPKVDIKINVKVDLITDWMMNYGNYETQ